jgi:DNA-binding MarR family transcriptional regulator
MDIIKESFNKVKEDIDGLRLEVEEIKKSIIDLCQIIEKITKKSQKEETNFQKSIPTDITQNSAFQQNIPTHSSVFSQELPLKQHVSTGNEGVPTDRQTNQQTDRHTENSIESAAGMLKSLDNIKKEIRQKFKKLTEQEWLVFSIIYQLDEEGVQIEYKALADRLKLTESSIRDYVGKLIKKGIPVEKIKLNNKIITLKISSNLKQIASLSTIITLRDL